MHSSKRSVVCANQSKTAKFINSSTDSFGIIRHFSFDRSLCIRSSTLFKHSPNFPDTASREIWLGECLKSFCSPSKKFGRHGEHGEHPLLHRKILTRSRFWFKKKKNKSEVNWSWWIERGSSWSWLNQVDDQTLIFGRALTFGKVGVCGWCRLLICCAFSFFRRCPSDSGWRTCNNMRWYSLHFSMVTTIAMNHAFVQRAGTASPCARFVWNVCVHRAGNHKNGVNPLDWAINDSDTNFADDYRMREFAFILDTVSVVAYFIVPIVLVWFLRRFNTILLGNLRTEIKWFALLTASGGVDHLLTAIGILPGNVQIQGMAVALVVF